MIKITTKYDEKADKCKVDYSSEKSNTLEHLYAIQCLVEQILANDVEMNWQTIRTILNNTLVDKEKKKEKEEKENAKRNRKSKAEV